MAGTKNPQIRLLHIRDEIDGMASAIQGVTFKSYGKSYALRALQIISEAAKSLPAGLTGKYPDAPWSAIISLGNILRHEYQHVDDRRLWEIATVHLPQLRTVVTRMLADLAQS